MGMFGVGGARKRRLVRMVLVYGGILEVAS